jgi:hypothetical protein
MSHPEDEIEDSGWALPATIVVVAAVWLAIIVVTARAVF